MITVTIEQKSGKGRVFQAVLLAHACADSLWGGGREGAIRPIFAQFACSDQEERPFVANLQAGNRAIASGEHFRRDGEPLELMRSANYVYRSRRSANGSIVTVFMPDLLFFDAGLIDPAWVRFALLPPAERIRREASALPPVIDHVHRVFPDVKLPEDHVETLSAMSMLFCGALSRRTPYGILPDARLQAQVYVAMLRGELASWSKPRYKDREFGRSGLLVEHGFEDVGLHPGVACGASQEAVGALLAEQIKIFDEVTRG